MKQYQPHASSIGNVAANLVACGIYALLAVFGGGFWTVIIAVIVLFSEKNSYLVKFSVVQSFLIMLAYNILRSIVESLFGVYNFSVFGFGWLKSLLSIGGGLLRVFASLALLLLYVLVFLYCAIKAYRWNQVELPLIGGIAHKIADSFGAVAYYGDGEVPPQAQPGGPKRQDGPYYSGQQVPPPNSPYSDTQQPHDPNSQVPPDMRDK